MSETELVNPSVSQLSTTRIMRPILKTISQKPGIIRLDWAGNEIIKGGQHKIAFQTKFARSQSDEENISNSFEELSEDIEQEYHEMVDYKTITTRGKFQPEQSNQSVCCCIY